MLRVKRVFFGVRGLGFHGDDLVCSRGFDLLTLARAADVPQRHASLPLALWQRVASRTPVLCSAWRLRVLHWLGTSANAHLLTTSAGLFRSVDDLRSFELLHSFEGRAKPAAQGLCAHRDGVVYYGDYLLNRDRSAEIALWRSADGGRHFSRLHVFPAGEVRHIHAVQIDPFTGHLWLMTGDTDSESRIMVSTDAGQSFDVVGAGSQLWRTVGLVFTEAHIYFGTDAGRDVGPGAENWICRFSRDSGHLEQLVRVPGPIHGGSQSARGQLWFSTGVEERGASAQANSVELWRSPDGEQWQSVASWQKDRWPLAVQFGVAHFLPGQRTQESLWLNLMGVRGGQRLVELEIGEGTTP